MAPAIEAGEEADPAATVQRGQPSVFGRFTGIRNSVLARSERLIFGRWENKMKTFLYLTGIASFTAGMVALLLGVREFYAALFICVGSVVAASSDGWKPERKRQITGLAFLVLLCAFLLVSTFTEEGPGSFSGMRIPWIGVPLLTAVVVLAVLRVRGVHRQSPNQPPPRNAGSRPSSGDSPASETPFSLGPSG